MKSAPFAMVCHKCAVRYSVTYARRADIERIVNVLKFAVCPKCGTPRDAATYYAYEGQKRCVECHVPESLLPTEKAVRKVRKGLISNEYAFRDSKCVPCYFQGYYRRVHFVVNKPASDTIKA